MSEKEFETDNFDVEHTGPEEGLSVKRFGKVEDKEQLTARNSASMTPFEVQMPVQFTEEDPRIHFVAYYVRAPSPNAASIVAARCFMRWEKVDKGLEFHKYPDISDVTEGTCTVMDDDDWQIAWKHAKRHPHKSIGPKDNPSIFVFWPKGYEQKAANPGIIVPSTADIKNLGNLKRK